MHVCLDPAGRRDPRGHRVSETKLSFPFTARHRFQYGLIMSPTEVGRYGFTSVRSVYLSLCLSPIHFSPALSIVQAVKHETLTQCWAIVGPPSTTLTQQFFVYTKTVNLLVIVLDSCLGVKVKRQYVLTLSLLSMQ